MKKPLIAAGLSLLLAATAWGAPLSYVVTLGGDFGTLDNATGSFNLISCIPGDCAVGSQATGIAYGPGGALLVDTNDLGLLSVDPSNGQTTVVGQHPGISFLTFAGLGDGRLFGIGYDDGNLYEVNPLTGDATLISHLYDSTDIESVSLAGDGVNLYLTYFAPPDAAVPQTGTLYRINPNTGALTMVGSTADNITGSSLIDGILYGYTSADQGEHGGFIYKLSLGNGDASLVSSYRAGDLLFPDLPIYGGVATPEPTTVGMVLTGAAILLVFRRRRA